METRDLTKNEKKKLKATIERLRGVFPYIRGRELEFIAYNIAITGAIQAAEAEKISTKLVFWPQQTSEATNELPKKSDIMNCLKLFNEHKKLTHRKTFTKDNKQQYEFQHVLDAKVLRFKKAALAGVKFMGLTLTDGTKIRMLLDSPSEAKKKAQKARGPQFQMADEVAA